MTSNSNQYPTVNDILKNLAASYNGWYEDELIYKIISKWDDEFSNDPNWYKEDGDDVKDRLVMKCDEYFVSFVKEWIKNTCDDVDWWDFNSDTMILSIMNCASGDVSEEEYNVYNDMWLDYYIENENNI
tara:strand:- start:73 stop:459 length:387 start_codon:yes stop_codon:yes gene_type:complete